MSEGPLTGPRPRHLRGNALQRITLQTRRIEIVGPAGGPDLGELHSVEGAPGPLRLGTGDDR
jgi:hypothetical protein